MNADLILDHWELGLLLITWSVIVAVAAKRRYEWGQRRFSQQVNFSLNILSKKDGASTLLLRTLLEDTAANVWINEYGVSRVLRATRFTSLDDPFLHITQQRDRDLVMIAVLNVLSERFSDAFVARVLGIPTKSDTFLFGLTWERYGQMKTQKLRVIVIKQADLESMFAGGADGQDIRVVEKSHVPRKRTLCRMYKLWTSSNADERGAIGEVVLGMPFHLESPHVA